MDFFASFRPHPKAADLRDAQALLRAYEQRSWTGGEYLD
jgi:hypothetical protein